MRVRRRVQQLHRDPHAVALRGHRDRPGHDRLYAQFRRDLGEELVRGGVALHRRPRHDAQARQDAQLGDDLLVQLAREEVVVLGEVGQWEHGYSGDGSIRVEVREGRDAGRRGHGRAAPIRSRQRVRAEPENTERSGNRGDAHERELGDHRPPSPPHQRARSRETLRREVVYPRKRQDHRQSQEHEDHQRLQHPVRRVERGQHDLAQLQYHKRGCHVHTPGSDHAAPAQLAPESARLRLLQLRIHRLRFSPIRSSPMITHNGVRRTKTAPPGTATSL